MAEANRKSGRPGPRNLLPVRDESGTRIERWQCSECSWLYALPEPLLAIDFSAASMALTAFRAHRCQAEQVDDQAA